MTSITIYTNEKNYPYVYRLDNPITNEFYIGYRKANLVPAEKDLGTDYFTSAPTIKERFNEFQSTIIAEFFNPNDAYDHEQYLIYCNLGNSLMLNKRCHYGKKRFNNIGSPTEETRAKLSASQKGKSRGPKSEETRAKMSDAHANRPLEEKEATSKKLSDIHTNRSPEERLEFGKKISESKHNRTDEERAATIAKDKATKANKTPEQNAAAIQKRLDTIANKSPEERAATNKKLSNFHTNRSPEERAATLEKQKQTFLEKYGYENPYQNPAVRAKKKQTEDNKPILTCPHCNSSGKGGNWTRWHFDKCKLL